MARADPGAARHQQGPQHELDLRPPHHPGGRIGPLPRADRGAAAGRGRLLRTHLRGAARPPIGPLRWEVDTTPALLGTGAAASEELIEKQAQVLQLIRRLPVRGHLVANLDPLESRRAPHSELDPATYGLTLWDLDREFFTDGLAGKQRASLQGDARGPARDLLRQRARRSTCTSPTRSARNGSRSGWNRAAIAASSSPRRACACSSAWSRPRASSASCTGATSATNASRSKAARP